MSPNGRAIQGASLLSPLNSSLSNTAEHVTASTMDFCSGPTWTHAHAGAAAKWLKCQQRGEELLGCHGRRSGDCLGQPMHPSLDSMELSRVSCKKLVFKTELSTVCTGEFWALTGLQKTFHVGAFQMSEPEIL
eukprot:1159619-Pelagomonas_calceolata.AAC.2